MIFVTVGTHEQQFDRLVQCVDELKASGSIQEEVMIQTGFSEYEPQYCEWSKIVPYGDMTKNIEKARIVITHGGPASFIMPLQMGKIPIVVPRRYEMGEHVNNHQVEFVKAVAERMGNIIPVYEIGELENILMNYDSIVSNMPAGLKSNNKEFNRKLKSIVNELV